ncbi:hypothetical protein MAHJHV29_49810 [Mycobacterium avium subsp. hominissuis]
MKFADGSTLTNPSAALAAGDWSSDSESKLLLPGSISIARVIIESWAAQVKAKLAEVGN